MNQIVIRIVIFLSTLYTNLVTKLDLLLIKILCTFDFLVDKEWFLTLIQKNYPNIKLNYNHYNNSNLFLVFVLFYGFTEKTMTEYCDQVNEKDIVVKINDDWFVWDHSTKKYKINDNDYQEPVFGEFDF